MPEPYPDPGGSPSSTVAVTGVKTGVCGLDHGPGGSCYIAAGYAGIYLATSMVRRVRLRR